MSVAYWEEVRTKLAAAAVAEDWERAETLLKRAVQRRDAPPAVLHNLGRVLEKRRKIAQAVHWFRAAIKADPHYPPSWLELGRCLMARRDFAGAVDAFRHAGQLMPQDTDCRRLAGRAAMAGADWQVAAEVFGELLRLAPSDEEALVKGYVALAELRAPEALALRDRLLADDGLRGEALNATVRASAGRLPLRPLARR